MSVMMRASSASTWSAFQDVRDAFCVISSALTATPPALAALPGPKATPACWSRSTASGVVGMFAPSETAFTPLRISVAASSAFSSFCVADGRATSAGTSQTRPPGTYRAEAPRRSAYVLTRPRSTSLIWRSRSRSMPFSSTT